MYRFLTTLCVCLVLLSAGEADARKKLFGDNSRSTASIEIRTQDANALADALIEVFGEDGYDLVYEAPEQMNFARRASRMQELSYGTPLNPGSTELVYIDFFPVDEQTYRVECNVTIRTGAEASLADSNVLPLFGRQYKRMLRRVKRAM